jgi:hypothetical protein
VCSRQGWRIRSRGEANVSPCHGQRHTNPGIVSSASRIASAIGRLQGLRQLGKDTTNALCQIPKCEGLIALVQGIIIGSMVFASGAKVRLGLQVGVNLL